MRLFVLTRLNVHSSLNLTKFKFINRFCILSDSFWQNTSFEILMSQFLGHYSKLAHALQSGLISLLSVVLSLLFLIYMELLDVQSTT